MIIEDARKIKAAKAAVLSPDRFAKAMELDTDLRDAVAWIAQRGPIEVCRLSSATHTFVRDLLS